MAIFNNSLKSGMDQWTAVSVDSLDDTEPVCRICHGGSSSTIGPLHTCCHCRGSIQFVHRYCMELWLGATAGRTCELCGYDYLVVRSKIDYFEWLLQDRRFPFRWLLIVLEILFCMTIFLVFRAFPCDCNEIGWCPYWPYLLAFMTLGTLFLWCSYIYYLKPWLSFARSWWEKVKRRVLVLDIPFSSCAIISLK